VPYGQDEGEELDDNDDLPILDLQTRFLGLGTSTRISSGPRQRAGDDEDVEEDIDELLAELRDRAGKETEDDKEDVKTLVKDAKAFVASSKHLTRPEDIPAEAPANEDELLDEEADEYIQQVMAEIRSRTQTEECDEPKSSDANNTQMPRQDNDEESQVQAATPLRKSHSDPFDLPNTPSSPPRSSIQHQVQPSTSTGPDLPAAPTFLPADHPIHMADNRKGRGSTASMPAWCCICSYDARIKCLDCDGALLFCARCWREMHLEEGDAEERSHRAVEFTGNMQGAVG
jgi:hypothetical protein